MNHKPLYEFMVKRHRIYYARRNKEPQPWTKDPILQTYRFTNVYRELDRVTVWVRKHIREPFAGDPNLWFMLCIARQINLPATLQELIDTKGAWPSKNKWDVNKAVAVLDARTQRREQVFTGAYIITNGGIAEPKTHVVMERYLQPLWEVRAMLGPQMRSSSIQAAHRALVQYLGWGGFMAYEVMCDLRYTAFLNRAIDKSTWAHAGPGALRGLGRLNGKLPAPREAVVQMQNLLNLISPLWYLAFPKDPLLEMREIEHSLCEFDKYERVRNGEGRPRSKYSPQDEGRLP